MSDPQPAASAVRPDAKPARGLRGREKAIEKSMTDHGSELFELVKAYAQQETIDPLKTIGRFVGVGLAASIVGGLGFILLLLGVLRVLQTETGEHLTGSLTWVPYLVTLVLAGILIAIALRAISATNKKKGTR